MNFERKYTVQKGCKILGLLLLYIGYLLGGGYLIEHIEGENDATMKAELRNKLHNTLRKYDLTPNDTLIKDIVAVALEAHGYGVELEDAIDVGVNVTSMWNWLSGVFFCNTLVTTVGMYLTNQLLHFYFQ